MWKKVKTLSFEKLASSAWFLALVKLLEAASYIAGVVALAIIAYQLFSDAADRRVARSLAMIERYSDEPMTNYRSAVREFEFEHRVELSDIAKNGGLSLDDARRWVSGRMEAYETRYPDRELIVSTMEIASFFDQIATCEKSALCDSDTVNQFLSQEANEMNCTYGHVVAEQAIVFNRPNLGEGLKQLAGSEKCAE